MAQRKLLPGIALAAALESDRDTLIRLAAFDHIRRLSETHDHLTARELRPGFVFAGERIPLMNPQRGIFKPQQMRFASRQPAGNKETFRERGLVTRNRVKQDGSPTRSRSESYYGLTCCTPPALMDGLPSPESIA